MHCKSWLNQLNDEQSRSPEMVLKIHEIVRRGEGDYDGKDLWKRVWSGTKMEWCIVKVVVVMMMNWSEIDDNDSDRDIIININRFAKFFRKFIPETRWGAAKKRKKLVSCTQNFLMKIFIRVQIRSVNIIQTIKNTTQMGRSAAHRQTLMHTQWLERSTH